MGQFNAKIFNADVFGKYLERIPRVKQNKLLEAGVMRTRGELKTMLSAQSGGNYITVPMKGLIEGTPLNYDGATNITADGSKTFSQSMVVVGRAKAWTEMDFSADITGEDFLDNIAQQVSTYWSDVDQDTMLSILKGIFAMTGTGNLTFVTNHTTDITAETGDAAKVAATTLNTAIQKAAGDNKAIFKLVICHSVVATNLENISAINYLKYTDAKGVERDLGMATWNGRLVLVDDGVPAVDVPASDAVSAVTGVKAKYTLTISAKAVAETAAAVVVNKKDSTGTLDAAIAETTKGVTAVAAVAAVTAHTAYTSYILGDGAFDFADVGAKVPNAMVRDELTNGGVDTLVTRQRKLFAPRGISFTKVSMASSSPTDAELETGANWELVNDGNAISKTYINHKAIPIARIISRG